MTNIALNGLLLLLILLFHFPFRKREEYTDLLTRDDSFILKGYFSLVIICHHLAQRIEPGSLFQAAFNDAGYCAVAVFFFITGYGVMKSYLNKPGYAAHFLKNHVRSVIIPAVIAVGFHWGAYALQRDGYSFFDFFGLFFMNTRSTSFLWYVFMIGAFYPSIARSMKNADGDPKRVMRGAWTFVVVTVGLGLVLAPFAFWIYDTNHLLAIGMMAAYYEKDWMEFLSKHTFGKMLGSIILGIVSVFIALFVINSHFVYWVGMNFYRSIDSFLVIAILLLLFCKIRLTSPLMKELGIISYEIYLLHGIFLMMYRGKVFNISNDFVWAVATILSSVAAAYLFHKLIVRFRQ